MKQLRSRPRKAQKPYKAFGFRKIYKPYDETPIKETIMSKTAQTVATASTKTMNGLKVARDIAIAVAPTVIATAVAVVIVRKLEQD